MFKKLKKSQESLEKSYREEAIALAIKNEFELYEIETYYGWRIRLVFPNGESTHEYNSRNLRDCYRQVANFLRVWEWKDKEERIV